MTYNVLGGRSKAQAGDQVSLAFLCIQLDFGPRCADRTEMLADTLNFTQWSLFVGSAFRHL